MSRALSLAAVTILAGLIGGAQARAENLDAGKPPAKIFSDTCSACHKTSRGLLKTVGAGSLPGFLRQHYTTSSDMAGALSAYLLTGGGATERVAEPKQASKKDAKQEGKQDTAAAPSQGNAQPAGQTKQNRQANRSEPDGRAATGPDDPAAKSAKQKRGKKGAVPDADTAKLDQPKEPPKDESKTDIKPDTAKVDEKKPDENKAETAKSEPSVPGAASPTAPAGSGASPVTGTADAKPTDSKSDVKAGEASGAGSSEGKSKEASLPLPPVPTSTPKPARKPMLTLPGFPLPVEDPPSAETTATPTVPDSATPKPASVGATTTPDAPKPEAVTPAPAASEQPKVDQQKSESKPNEAKALADQAAAPDKPKLDIIQDEQNGKGKDKAGERSELRKKRVSEPKS